MTVPGAGS